MLIPDIPAAVNECLAQANKEKMPFVAVSAYLRNLERKAGWTKADVQAVNRAVTKALQDKRPEPPGKRR